jgi:hypothetical protein
LFIGAQQGPVLITVRYEVAKPDLEDFLREIKLLGSGRQRDGATFWQIFEDATNPGSYMETYVVATWLDHLRQHERISKQDALIQQRIRVLLQPGTVPLVSHFVHPLVL